MINQAIIISDLHCGCQFGLCPPEPQTLDGGGVYRSSPLQVKVWDWWREFWDDWVPRVTHGEPFALVINGDTTDGRHHNSTTQVSQNLKDQRRIALNILRPIVERIGPGKLYMTRGTEAHVGPAGENEETLAEELGAVPDSQGNHARYELWMRLGGPDGALCHILHHIGTTGRTHYETSAPQCEYAELSTESGRWNYQAPDIVVRSHRHRYIKTESPSAKGYGISLTTPGWQLRTPFVMRIPGGRVSTPQFGGVLIRQGDEEHYSRAFIRNVTRAQEVVI